MSENDVNETGRWTSRESPVIPSMSDRTAAAANSAAIDRLIRTPKYVYIIAWGKWLGFTPETVQKSVVEAEADDAPAEALQKIDGRWLFLGDIVNDENRSRVEALAKQHRLR